MTMESPSFTHDSAVARIVLEIAIKGVQEAARTKDYALLKEAIGLLGPSAIEARRRAEVGVHTVRAK
jgi:hypothetical protein